MGEMAHTPGEWQALAPAKEGKHWKVCKRLGEADERLFIVAQIHNGAPGDTLETEAANARLIAAAPKMLAMLQRYIESDAGIKDELTADALAAVAKAVGR